MSSALNVVYYLAIILIFTKTLGLVARRCGLPQVVGMVLAGIILGLLSNLHKGSGILSFIMKPNEEENLVLETFSQIGVILILFSSGLETSFTELKKSGGKATIIALAGVLVPILFGTLGAMAFMGFDFSNKAKLFNALFIGAILAATSVGITVETLKEMGKLSTKVGNTILSAAIIDDVIGILALSIITSFTGNATTPWWLTLIKLIGFFVFTIGVGIGLRILFKYIEKKHPHTRRTSIYAFAMCFLYAFCAEKFFGVAAITGAFMAGIMLSGMPDTKFVDRKAVVTGYMIFTPIFFAYIGISADFSLFTWSALLFGLVFVLLGILGKIVGCFIASKGCRFNNKESTAISFGMIARGEVALAIYKTGEVLICEGGIDPLVGVIFLIVLSSILCPIFLKLIFKKIDKDDNNNEGDLNKENSTEQGTENPPEVTLVVESQTSKE